MLLLMLYILIVRSSIAVLQMWCSYKFSVKVICFHLECVMPVLGLTGMCIESKRKKNLAHWSLICDLVFCSISRFSHDTIIVEGLYQHPIFGII